MSKLTDVAIRALKPKAADYFVRDAGAPGRRLGVRVRPTGAKSFEFVYDFAGRRQRLTYGAYGPDGLTLTAAREAHAEAVALLAKGLDPKEQRREVREAIVQARDEDRRNPTVATLGALYIEQHARVRKRSWREDQRILNADVNPAWGNRKAKDITRADVNHLLDGITARGRKAKAKADNEEAAAAIPSRGVMANRTLALVRKLFNFAIARGMLGNQSNPATLVERRTLEAPRERVLNDDEVHDAWNGIDAAPMARHTALAAKLILVTGQRPGEVAGMEWDELSGDWWTIPSAKAKNKTAHRVYLSTAAKALLAELEKLKTSDRFVFPGAHSDDKSITVRALAHAVRDWLNERKTAERWTPHDLRRTCGTGMGALGIERFIQDRVLNHKDATIGAVYDLHEYDDDKRRALSKWGRRLSEIVKSDGASAGKVVPLRR